MLAAFQEHLNVQFPNLKEQLLLVAISGGLDSVVLTHLLHQAGFKIALAHCNFNLRATESDEDEVFVKQLAQTLNIECHIKHCDTTAYAAKQGVSIQMAARDLRYDFFQELCESNDYGHILTAHHLDDQLETFLINLNRGAGLDGLQGIPQVNGRIVRPLLTFSRDQIKEHALNLGIQWREDSSNSSNKYQRNQLRNEILPLLHTALPHLKAHFTQTLDYLNGSQDLVVDALARFRESGIKQIDTTLHINIAQLKDCGNPTAYLYELIKEYGFHNLNDVMSLTEGLSGKRIESFSHVIFRNRESLVIEKLTKVIPVDITIDNFSSSYKFYEGVLRFETIPVDNALELAKKNKEKNVLYLDAAQVTTPLQLRNWKQGDRITPLGMNGNKLVSDVLTDGKVPFIAKEKIVVLTSSEDILWIVGIRSSNAYKVTKSTKILIKLTYII